MADEKKKEYFSFKKFGKALVELWTTPAYDVSDTMTSRTNVEAIKTYIRVSNEMYLEEVKKALNDTKMFDAMIIDGVVVATDSFERKQRLRQKYEAKENNGSIILELKEAKKLPRTIKNTLMMDESDTSDYENRYVSLDLKVYPEDGSTISFIRIMGPRDESGLRKVVFPFEMNSPGITNNKFKQFIVMQMSAQHQERMQIVETNEHYQALFFGKRAESLQISGLLKHTIENPWSQNMLFAWDEYMRGTKLVEGGNICQLFIDGVLYEGYPFNFTRSKSASADYLVNFNMGFLVKERFSIVS